MQSSVMRPGLTVVMFIALGVGTVGCGGNTVRVTGRLMKDGQPYPQRIVPTDGKGMEMVAAEFVGAVEGVRYMFPFQFEPDGSFRVVGSDGRGIPRGTYKITLVQSGVMGEGGDRFKGKYSSDNTPLTLTITGNTELMIDIGTGTIAMN